MLRKICYMILFIFITAELYGIDKDKICPYELVSFDAVESRDSINRKMYVNLTWVTASELNTDKFVVERYFPDIITIIEVPEFEGIAEVQASGNSNTNKYYNYSDTLILNGGPAYYRIKGVDKDSSFSYSNQLKIDNFTDIAENNSGSHIKLIEKLYPLPAKNILNIEISKIIQQEILIQLIDFKGYIVTMKEIANIYSANYMETIDISGLCSGEYLLVVKVGSIIETRKIVIVK